MTWSLLVMCWCTSTWARCLGRDWKPPPRDRSMSASAKRRCPPPLKFFARATHVCSKSCVISNIFWMLIRLYVWPKTLDCNTDVFLSHSWICHVPQLLPVTAIWWQARLLVLEATLQESVPQTGLFLWLRVWLEHAQICKYMSGWSSFLFDWPFLRYDSLFCFVSIPNFPYTLPLKNLGL